MHGWTLGHSSYLHDFVAATRSADVHSSTDVAAFFSVARSSWLREAKSCQIRNRHRLCCRGPRRGAILSPTDRRRAAGCPSCASQSFVTSRRLTAESEKRGSTCRRTASHIIRAGVEVQSPHLETSYECSTKLVLLGGTLHRRGAVQALRLVHCMRGPPRTSMSPALRPSVLTPLWTGSYLSAANAPRSYSQCP